ncbi:MAG TPA: M23 family metallopeptidase [Candidatus Dojkabacteria bacterium]|nr:M23 family metallopeptidase [Candidatus Dojkabacteria bacterium]
MKQILKTLTTILTILLIPLFAQENPYADPPGIREDLILRNQDIELLTPQYGQRFELGEDILLTWKNKNPNRRYYYAPYFYYVVGDFQMGTSSKMTEDLQYTIQPFQKSVIVLQLYYYDIDKYYTSEREEHTYVSDILVLSIGMDIPEYWLRRFEKKHNENPNPEQPVVIIPALTPTTKPTTKPKPIQKPSSKSKKDVLGENKKPFIFPFSKPVGVSQWHGYTDYQKPHTGIDFSVAREETRAVGDGLVVGKGYDTYYGKCQSGGNFLTIQQDNGMFTVYFHLDQSYVDVGKKVKKGEVIAKTGNSGSWNCQPLAYHLHFETRKKRSQSTHVDPVKYIEQDWNLIPTANYKKYPGRLSGDNPHPGR